MNSILLMFMLINMVRTNYNVQPLVIDKQLEVLANTRAIELYKSNQTLHTGWKRYFADTQCWYVGENFSNRYEVVDSLVGQMKSPTHKANIILPRYDTIGIGVYKTVIVELFCDLDND